MKTALLYQAYVMLASMSDVKPPRRINSILIAHGFQCGVAFLIAAIDCLVLHRPVEIAAKSGPKQSPVKEVNKLLFYT